MYNQTLRIEHSSDHAERRPPTRAEIRAACREIQKTWSPQERARRLMVRPVRWELPVITWLDEPGPPLNEE